MQSASLMRVNRIAVICGDAGGTNSLVPVISLLTDDSNFRLIIFS